MERTHRSGLSPSSAAARLTVATLVTLGLLAGVLPGAAADRPRFGEADWVTPVPAALDSGDVVADGPRVAEPDRPRTWETILRTPFRLAFLPLRIVGMGATAAAGIVGPSVRNPADYRVYPIVTYSATSGPAVGLGVRYPDWLRLNSVLSVQGTYSQRDHRRLRLKYGLNEKGEIAEVVESSPKQQTLRPTNGFGIEAAYSFRPNRRFYGIGNFSDRERRAIYLEEEGKAEVFVRLGRDLRRQLRLLGGYSNISARRGYNGGRNGIAIDDEFSPVEVPYLNESTDMLSYGIGADVATLDGVRDPSLGVHARAELRRFHGIGGDNLEYNQWHLEARGYLPVFAKRRVIALRLVHQNVDTREDAAIVPFYRLPTSADETRFAAYKNGRFRDRQLALGRLEYRWIVWDRVSAVGLAELGEVASASSRLKLADAHESYGFGLRYAASDRSVIRLEAAKGSEGMSVQLEAKGDF